MKKRNQFAISGPVLFEELEPRVLLSADLPVDVLAALAPTQLETEPADIREEAAPTPTTVEEHAPRELVFIDTDTPDYQLLVDDIRGNSSDEREIEVILLDNNSDGITQVTDALSKYSELDAVHIISHGSDGSIDLGATRLEFDTLLANSTTIQSWSDAFSENGDLLIYGCNLVASQNGQSLINSLARLTGADVATSDDLTGNAALGGDWELEYSTGSIETRVVASAQAQKAWQGTLAQTLWLSTDSNVGVPGADGLTSGWTEGQVLAFGGPDLAHGGATDGDLSIETDFDSFTLDPVDVGALHFVGRDLTVGGGANTFDLNAGDVLVSFLQDETILAAYTTSGSNEAYSDGDLLVFRPQTVGNYSTGTFHLLLDEVVPDDLKGVTLVEQAITIGGTPLAAGSFLVISEASATNTIDYFVPTGVGAGTTTGTTTPLIDIGNLGIDTNELRGIELIEAATTVGGQPLAAGSLLATLNGTDSVPGVGSNNLLVDSQDVFVLDITSTGIGTTAGTATMFLDGSDVGLDGVGGQESPYALALANYSRLVVDTTSDASDGDVSSVDALLADKGADGKISLREAIEATNVTANGDIPDVIHFNIPDPLVGGTHTTLVGAGGLPGINDSVIIDGSTDPDYAGTPVIRIDGASAGANVDGLSLSSAADGSVVRGLMITRFLRDGLLVQSGADNITIAGNWIGTTGTGSTGVGNSDDGIDLQGSNATIGGTGANDRNVITNSGDEGIDIVGSGVTGHVIQGNYIGLDPDGATGPGNTDVGIAIISGSGNTIGGTTAAARNVISNNFEGIEINTADNVVQGNYIGTDATGALDRGNRNDDGVEVQGGGTGNLIGGTSAGAGNLIAFNALNGVHVKSGTGNTVLGNQIHSNSGIGIDLGTAGVTLNDVGDPDPGANNLQNYPVITQAELSGTDLTLSGTLDTDGLSTQYRIEFFGNAVGTQDATNGEGRFYLGTTTVTTDGSGDASFSNITLTGVTLSVGDYVTATATRIDDPAQVGVDDALAYGNTSEFAQNVAITDANQAPVINDDTATVAEDAINTTVVYDVNDANTGNDTDIDTQPLTYSITAGNTDSIFTINSTTGVLTVTDNTNLDYETTQQYILTVEATDGTNIDTADITIDVTNVNDNAPNITSDGGGATATIAIDENTTAVTDVNATDADGTTPTYGFGGGADDGFFTIDGLTGVLAFSAAPDFETAADANGDNVYEVIVEARDGVNTTTQAISVSINNLNDNAPNITSDGGGATAAIAIDENTTAVTDVNATDADGTTPTYGFGGGADDGFFTIDNVTGVLSFSAAPDFETAADANGDNVYEVIVEARDGVNTTSQAISVTVNDVVNENAPLINNATTSVAEDAINTTVVYDVNDANTGNDTDIDTQPLTYTITAGNTDSIFAINSSTGVITVADNTNLDYETTQQYILTVEATDGTNIDTADITIDVTNVNDNAPVITSDGGGATAAIAIDENTTAVTDVNATDADGTTPTYGFGGGADDGFFTIDGLTGVLAFTAAPDFETAADANGDNVYEVIVEARDGVNTTTQAISVSINNLNDNAPNITSDGGGATAAIAIDENTTAVTDVNATDADGTTPTYGFGGGADDGFFTIDSVTGVLAFTAAPDFEIAADANGDNAYEVIVEARDGVNTTTQAISVSINNLNDNAPNITSDGGGATAAIAIDENTTAVTDVDATDADGTTPTYGFGGGADDGFFTIDGVTGVLAFSAAPDFETAADANGDNVYEVIVEARDGVNTTTQAISVSINNLNDNAPNITSDGGGATAAIAIDENTTAVTDVTATDADGTTPTYGFGGGADDGFFTIDGVTGVLAFSAAPDFETAADANGDNVYEVIVEARDGVNTTTQAISVSINNLNDNAPNITSDGGGATAAIAIDENTTAVTDVTATDADGTTPTYGFGGGADDGFFTIDGVTGVLAFTAAPDFEIAADANGDNVYEVIVEARDGVNTTQQAISVTVNNLNDAPTNAVPGTQTIFQDTSLVFSGANGNAVTVADVDAGVNPIEVTLVANNGTVTLASTTGLTFAAGDGTADGSMTFTGTVANINSALNGLRFDPSTGFAGTTRLRIVTDDLGNSGAGGPLSDLDEVAIIVEADTVVAPPPDDPPPPPLDEILPVLTDDPPPPDPEETPEDPTDPQIQAPGPLPGQELPVFAPVSDFAPIEFAELTDDDSRGPANTSLTVPLLVKFAPDGAALEIPLPQAIWALIDDMKDQMSDAEGVLSDNGELVITSAAGVTVTLSAGYVSWLLRAGYLSASLLSAGPLWSQFDPLPVLAGARKKRKEEQEKHAKHQTPDSKVDNLFQAS